MNENINDGGPAFPVHADHALFNGRVVAAHHPGMSLRDYYAGQAQLAFTIVSFLGDPVKADGSPLLPEDFAKAAWENADMMLAARDRKEGN